eukprot:Pgem_evm1s5313
MTIVNPLEWYMNLHVDVYTIMFAETALLIVLQFSEKFLSEFTARKMCHAGSGALLLLLRSEEWEAR